MVRRIPCSSRALSSRILERAPALVGQGKWLFVSLSNFVIPADILQNSQDVCHFLTTVIARGVGGCRRQNIYLNKQMSG
jgi:hypothetical protein